MKAARRRAAIIGGSMSGLLCGLYLRRRGWNAEIFERSPVALTGRGAGIMTHPEMHAALAEFNLDTGSDFGIAVPGRLVLDADGNIIGRWPLPQIATSWNRLFEMLAAEFGADHYHLEKDFVHASQDADGITAHFADGSAVPADLLIGADGFRSSVRAQYLPSAQPLYAGYVGWRGLADEGAVSGLLTPEVFEHLSFFLPPGEQFLGYPVAGPGNDLRPGHRSWNVVWYRPANETKELPRLLTDASGHTHELSIPPPLIAPQVIADMRAAAERLLPPQFKAAMRCIEQPFLQPIYDLESPRMVFDRIALVGDAAFVIRPHVGAGIVKAMQDASSLAEALDASTTIEAGLAVYEAQRIAIGRRFIAQARRLGSYLKYQFDSETERVRAAWHAEPQQVMGETALLDFLGAPSH